jgi:hypothetical protein
MSQESLNVQDGRERQARTMSLLGAAGRETSDGGGVTNPTQTGRVPRKTLVKKAVGVDEDAILAGTVAQEEEQEEDEKPAQMEEVDILRTELSAALMQSEKRSHGGDTRITGDLHTNGFDHTRLRSARATPPPTRRRPPRNRIQAARASTSTSTTSRPSSTSTSSSAAIPCCRGSASATTSPIQGLANRSGLLRRTARKSCNPPAAGSTRTSTRWSSSRTLGFSSTGVEREIRAKHPCSTSRTTAGWT